MEAVACHVSHSIFFVQTALFANIIAISLWSGLKKLVSATLSILDPHQAPLGHPAATLCHRDPAALPL